MTPEMKQALAELAKTSYGQWLVRYLDLKFEDIGDVMKATTLEDLKGRQYALKVLNEMFAFLAGDNSKLGSSGKPKYN